MAIPYPSSVNHVKTTPRIPIKTSLPLSYASYYEEKRKTKWGFLQQIAQLMHWEAITHLLGKYCPTSSQDKEEKPIQH
jgi:hypothetical protein